MNCSVVSVGGYTLIPFPVLTPAQAEMVLRWRNTDTVRMWMFHRECIGTQDHLAYLEHLRGAPHAAYWMVVLPDGNPLGVVSLTRIDTENSNAYVGVYARPDQPVPGAGTLLMRCLHEVAFGAMGLHTLKLEVLASNLRAIGLYTKLGYCREGVLRQFLSLDGKREDVVVMGLIAGEGPL